MNQMMYHMCEANIDAICRRNVRFKETYNIHLLCTIIGYCCNIFHYSVDRHTSPFDIIFHLIYYRITLNLVDFFKKIHVNQIDKYEQK